MQATRGSNQDTIEELADRLEWELGALESCWSEIPDHERATVIRRIGAHAPGVARLLCPQFERFSLPHGSRAEGIG